MKKEKKTPNQSTDKKTQPNPTQNPPKRKQKTLGIRKAKVPPAIYE